MNFRTVMRLLLDIIIGIILLSLLGLVLTVLMVWVNKPQLSAPACACVDPQELADLKADAQLLKAQVEEGRRDTLALANILRSRR